MFTELYYVSSSYRDSRRLTQLMAVAERKPRHSWAVRACHVCFNNKCEGDTSISAPLRHLAHTSIEEFRATPLCLPLIVHCHHRGPCHCARQALSQAPCGALEVNHHLRRSRRCWYAFASVHVS